MEKSSGGISRAQGGVVSRAQLLGGGWTVAQVRHQLDSGRWQRALRGVYVTHNGEVGFRGWCWAAYLECGEEASLDGGTVLEVHGVLPPGLPIRIAVPAGRAVVSVAGRLSVVRRRRPRPSLRPAGFPPAAFPEHALLDHAAELSESSDVVALAAEVLQQGLTSPARLARAIGDRRFVPHRDAFAVVLGQFGDGATTVLEIAGVRNVLVRHGLPKGRGQVAESVAGRRVLRDRVIEPFGVVVEFDGRVGHTNPDDRVRDQLRDNEVGLSGRTTLRFGHRACHELACEAAVQVGRALRAAGWSGHLKPCGPGCRATAGARVKG